MAGAFTAIADDATATWWNPAGIASGAMLNLSLEYGRIEQPPDTGRGGFAFTIPSFGLSYYRMPVSEIQPTSSTANSAAGRQDPGTTTRTVELSQFGATVGQSIGNHLVLASTIKLLHMDQGTQFGLDIGAMAVLGVVKLGVTTRNLREPTIGDGADAFTLKRQVRAGAAVSTSASPKLAATVAFDADVLEVPSLTGNERRMAGGGEVWFWSHVVGVRGGFSGSTVGDARTSGAFGGSVMLHRGLFVEGQLTRGSDMTRRGWGTSFRVTF